MQHLSRGMKSYSIQEYTLNKIDPNSTHTHNEHNTNIGSICMYHAIPNIVIGINVHLRRRWNVHVPSYIVHRTRNPNMA